MPFLVSSEGASAKRAPLPYPLEELVPIQESVKRDSENQDSENQGVADPSLWPVDSRVLGVHHGLWILGLLAA